MGNIIGNIGQALHNAVSTVQQRFMPQQPVVKPPPLKIAPPPPKYQVKTNLPQPNFTSSQPAPSAKPVYKPPPAPLNLPAKVPLKLNTAGLNTSVGTAINPAGKTVSSYKPLPVVQPKPIVPPGTPFKLNTTGVNTRIGTGYKQTSINTAFGVPNTYKPEPFVQPKNLLTRDVATVGNIIKTGVIQPLARTALRMQALNTGQVGGAITPKGDIAKFFLGNKAFSTSVVQTGREMLQDQGVTKETAGKVNPLLAGGIGVAGILGEISNIIPVKGAEAATAKEGLALVKSAKTADEAMAALKAARPEVQDAVHSILVNPNTKIKTLKDLHTALNNEVLDQATQKGRVILSRNTMTPAAKATVDNPFKDVQAEKKGLLETTSSLKSQPEIRLQAERKTQETGLQQKSTRSGSSSSGSIPPNEDPVKKLITAIKEAKPIRAEQENTLYKQARSQKLAKLLSAREKYGGEEGFYKELASLKGALPKADYESIRDKVTQGEVDHLFNMVKTSPAITEWEKISAQTALTKVLSKEAGGVPTTNELKLLQGVFGSDLVKSLLDKRSFMSKVLSTTTSALNIPRTLMASMDFSGSFRQAVFAAPSHPLAFGKAFGSQFKQAFSEKAFQGAQKAIQSRPTYNLMRESKLALTDAGAFIDQREEKFAGELAERIPVVGKLVRGSERAYIGMLNRFRADLFDDMLKNNPSIKGNAKNERAMANLINNMTGRGEPPTKFLKEASPFLNGVLFSPRLLYSRVQLLNPVYYAMQPAPVRKEAIKSLLAFTATGLSVLGLAKLNGANVGLDPRSADFGKIKVGDTRIDIWGGFQPYVRLASQLITNQTVSTTTGKVTDLGKGYQAKTRKDLLQSFVENKEAPVASFVTGLLTGKNSIGQPFDVKSEIAQRFIPLAMQDTYDAVKDWGQNGLAAGVKAGIGAGVASTFGLGVQTYGGTPTSITDAKQQGGLSLYNYLKTLPKDKANQYLKDSNTITDGEYNRIVQYKKIDNAGLSQKEYNMVGSTIKDGTRAKLIWDQLQTMKSNDAKNTYIQKLDKAGLLGKDDTVINQLKAKKASGDVKVKGVSTIETKTPSLPTASNGKADWNTFKTLADKIGTSENFPPKVIKAVAAVESARGNSQYARERNNFFGYNAVDSNPDLATKFSTVEQGIKSYIQLIKDKYPAAYAARSNPDKMIALIKQGGYASDPNYISSVTGTPEWNQ